MEGGGLSFKFPSSLSIRCDKVDEPKGSSCIKTPNLLRYKNAKINQKNIDDRCLQYAFAFIQHYKKNQNHPE